MLLGELVVGGDDPLHELVAHHVLAAEAHEADALHVAQDVADHDEAQNTTPEQMKMFLTRLGFNSKMVVTGDITQIDLEKGSKSGLVEVGDILTGVEDINFIRFGGEDVVRHKLVQRIVAAYGEHAERQQGGQSPVADGG